MDKQYTIEEIEAMLEGITQERWRRENNVIRGLPSFPIICAFNSDAPEANIDFIAAAPSIIRQLFDKVKEYERVQSTLSHCVIYECGPTKLSKQGWRVFGYPGNWTLEFPEATPERGDCGYVEHESLHAALQSLIKE